MSMWRELGTRGRVLLVLIERIRLHIVFGDRRRLIAVLGERLKPRERSFHIDVAAHVGIHHAAHLEKLHIGVAYFAERGPLDHFCRALRIGPIEHLDTVGK